MINIAIATKRRDDRAAITTLLEKNDDFRIINIGKDGYDALKSAMTQRPDVIIMDFSMEDIDSPELAPIIKRNSPSTALIVLCSHEDQNAVARALNAGISGCVHREEDFNNLASSVRSVFHGGLYISKSARNPAVNCLPVPPEVFPAELNLSHYPFTSTEEGIFYGIIRGHTDREIAKNLNINIASLRNCINRTKKKTGLHNRTQITIYALLTGKIKELASFPKTWL